MEDLVVLKQDRYNALLTVGHQHYWLFIVEMNVDIPITLQIED